MTTLEEILRAIVAKNRQQRADFDGLSARVVNLTLTGTEEEIEKFHDELGERFQQLLQGQGQDTTASGADSSASTTTAGSGESAEQ